MDQCMEASRLKEDCGVGQQDSLDAAPTFIPRMMEQNHGYSRSKTQAATRIRWRIVGDWPA